MEATERLAYTVEEAAELCGVSESTMRLLIKSGEIYAPKMGDLRIGRAELLRFLSGEPAPRPQNDTEPPYINFTSTPQPRAVRPSPQERVFNGIPVLKSHAKAGSPPKGKEGGEGAEKEASRARAMYAVTDAAKLMGVDRQVLYRAIQKGNVPTVKLTAHTTLIPAWFVHGEPDPSGAKKP